jgi:hypothetical protein
MKILLIGLGNLGSCILDMLVRIPGKHIFLVAGRNKDYLQQRTNLSLLMALQLGSLPEITCTFMDLGNIDHTATIIAQFQPTIILYTATLQSLGRSDHFPPTITQQLAAAPMGPRLPLHLVLLYKLMQAIQQTGLAITVLNAIYPDVVNPILGCVGLAPTTGIGDLANNIPALRMSIADALHQPIESVDVRVVMARYVSYWITRMPMTNAPFHLTTLVHNEDQTALLDRKTLFDPLRTTLKRIGGVTGLLMTAASATLLFEGIVRNTGVITHAPGPHGLPGGYPVKVTTQGIEVLLPETLSLQEAIQINNAGLRLDGIEKIESNGTIFFTETSVSIYKEILGYDCRRMPLSDVEERAKELQQKYHAFASRFHQ